MDSVLFGRALDAPLDRHGGLQAQRLAERFVRYPDLLIEASPRQRAQQTAAAIAARTHCAVHTAPELDEVDFGRWAGLPFTVLEQDPAWRRWNERRGAARTPAGEAMSAVQERVIRHVHDMQRAHPWRTIALVTHAEVIRAALLHFIGAPLDRYADIEIGPASISTLSIGGEHEAAVHSINELFNDGLNEWMEA